MVTFDLRGRMPGRGAYICPDAACFIKAEKRASFQKALGVPVVASDLLSDVLKTLTEDLLKRIFFYRARGEVVEGEYALYKAKPGDLVLFSGEIHRRRIKEMRQEGIDVLEIPLGHYADLGSQDLLCVSNVKEDSWLYKDVMRIGMLSSGGLNS